jgi:hypothetical protein
MKRTSRMALATGMALAAGFYGLSAGDLTELATSGSVVASAQARIGRPLTPLSYAGVARRTTRRAVAAGAYVGAVAVPAAVIAAPRAGCYRVVDAYGRTFWRCP